MRQWRTWPKTLSRASRNTAGKIHVADRRLAGAPLALMVGGQLGLAILGRRCDPSLVVSEDQAEYLAKVTLRAVNESARVRKPGVEPRAGMGANAGRLVCPPGLMVVGTVGESTGDQRDQFPSDGLVTHAAGRAIPDEFLKALSAWPVRDSSSVPSTHLPNW